MNTIIDLFERSCTKFGNNNYLWEKSGGAYQATTYIQVRKQARGVAAGLLCAGLEKGDRIALLSEGCNNWVYCELGIMYAAGINVPLSMKLTEKELVFRINHSGARFVIVSRYYLNVLKNIRQQIPEVEQVYVLGGSEGLDDKCSSFDTLMNEGKAALKQRSDVQGKLVERTRSLTAEDVANISYTSGTIADPKGIMLTHGNYVSNVLQADSLVHIPEHYKVLLYLPWDHSFAHTVGIYSFMYNGASLASVDFGQSPMEYLRNIPVNLKEVQPQVLLSVPAIAKNFRKNIESGIRQQGKIVEALYNAGLKVAYIYNGSGNHERHFQLKKLLYPFVKLVDWLMFAKIRRSFGNNLQFFIGGGALLDVELQRYFCALGIPMLQGYGLSEASPVISSNTPDLYKFGSSGQLVKPMNLKICDPQGKEMACGEQGEIVIRGGNVMKGYWKNEKATTEVINEGWLHTGDLGYVDKQGFLYVLGRFKSLLIANDGEKFSPEGIEEAIASQSRFIDYCILYNNQSLYTSALIEPNRTALKEYVKHKDVELGSVESYKLMLAKINEELMDYRYGGRYEGLFPERWLPAVVVILPESLDEKNGAINSTSKIVRWKVIELFQAELEYVYTPEGKDIQNVRNTRNIRHYMEN